jgi:hypothetical protein
VDSTKPSEQVDSSHRPLPQIRRSRAIANSLRSAASNHGTGDTLGYSIAEHHHIAGPEIACAQLVHPADPLGPAQERYQNDLYSWSRPTDSLEELTQPPSQALTPVACPSSAMHPFPVEAFSTAIFVTGDGMSVIVRYLPAAGRPRSGCSASTDDPSRHEGSRRHEPGLTISFPFSAYSCPSSSCPRLAVLSRIGLLEIPSPCPSTDLEMPVENPSQTCQIDENPYRPACLWPVRIVCPARYVEA